MKWGKYGEICTIYIDPAGPHKNVACFLSTSDISHVIVFIDNNTSKIDVYLLKISL